MKRDMKINKIFNWTQLHIESGERNKHDMPHLLYLLSTHTPYIIIPVKTTNIIFNLRLRILILAC